MSRMIIIALLGLFVFTTVSFAQDMPDLSDLPAGEWSQIDPGGDTLCARGEEYKFFVRPGNSDKLHIHFQGGGACWDDFSCSIGNANSEGGGLLGAGVTLFKDRITIGEGIAYADGIFDTENASNPISDYNVVLVNYCTADIHYGGGDTVYNDVVSGEEITVHHRGVENADTVLDWTFENFTDPSSIFITGCSAGAYGSIRHSPTILDHYSGVPAAQLGDSGVGGLLDPAFAGFDNWRFWETVPEFIDALPHDEFTTTEHYIATAEQYPDATFSQYNTFLDEVQIFFAGLLNGVDLTDNSAIQQLAIDWAGDMVNSVNSINAMNDNFDFFVMAGNKHCILNDPAFFEYSAGEVALSDWVADLVDGDGASDVSCDIEAAECFTVMADG